MMRLRRRARAASQPVLPARASVVVVLDPEVARLGLRLVVIQKIGIPRLVELGGFVVVRFVVAAAG
jgi:hypothetical protein